MKLTGVKSDFRDYRHSIEDHLCDRPEFAVCLHIFNYLTSIQSFKLQYVTYGTLMQIAGCKSDEFANLVKATDYLTTPHAHLLDMYFEYCDEDMEEPEPIDHITVHHALKKGEFYHPISGQTIRNFTNYIYPVFRPSEKLLEFRSLMILECE